MNGRKITVAVGGLIRHPEFFLHCLRQLAAVKRDGLVRRIVFTAWRNDLDAHPGVAAACAQDGIDLLPLDQPPPSSGHFLHQVRAVRAVADLCDADEFLLRTRTDVRFENLDGLRALLRHPLDLPDTGPLPRLFQNRVWVPSAVLLCPFYLWDTAIFGRAADLAQFFTYDIGEDVEADPRATRATATEIRLFLRPFLRPFPVLAAWRRLVGAGCACVGTRGRDGGDLWTHDLRTALTAPLFHELLAVYWLILHRYFLIGRSGYAGSLMLGRDGDDIGRPLSTASRRIGLADMIAPDAIDHDRFADNLRLAPDQARRAYVSNSDWFARLFDGDRFGEAAAVEPMLAALGRGLTVNAATARRADAEALVAAILAARPAA